jgi:hypothetical protein
MWVQKVVYASTTPVAAAAAACRQGVLCGLRPLSARGCILALLRQLQEVCTGAHVQQTAHLTF